MPKRKSTKVYHLKIKLAAAKKIWRLIAIRGDQTLDDLHEAIFKAFDRYDEHLYSFYFLPPGVKGRNRRRQATEFTHPYGVDEGSFWGGEPQRSAADTTIDDLTLQKGQLFEYLFDFGDSWEHEIVVERIEDEADNKKYPRILKKEGKSPPQYPLDEEDEFEEDDDLE